MWPIGPDSFDWVFVCKRANAACQNGPVAGSFCEIPVARGASLNKDPFPGPDIAAALRQAATVWQDIDIPSSDLFLQSGAPQPIACIC